MDTVCYVTSNERPRSQFPSPSSFPVHIASSRHAASRSDASRSCETAPLITFSNAALFNAQSITLSAVEVHGSHVDSTASATITAPDHFFAGMYLKFGTEPGVRIRASRTNGTRGRFELARDLTLTNSTPPSTLALLAPVTTIDGTTAIVWIPGNSFRRSKSLQGCFIICHADNTIARVDAFDSDSRLATCTLTNGANLTAWTSGSRFSVYEQVPIQGLVNTGFVIDNVNKTVTINGQFIDSKYAFLRLVPRTTYFLPATSYDHGDRTWRVTSFTSSGANTILQLDASDSIADISAATFDPEILIERTSPQRALTCASLNSSGGWHTFKLHMIDIPKSLVASDVTPFLLLRIDTLRGASARSNTASSISDIDASITLPCVLTDTQAHPDRLTFHARDCCAPMNIRGSGMLVFNLLSKTGDAVLFTIPDTNHPLLPNSDLGVYVSFSIAETV